ncbi:CBS domain-containing protein [Candidatus Micrarchaeota archaeon]|nr:CBS domain-containing protein [Candidatus Micrarchaeota archaeon]
MESNFPPLEQIKVMRRKLGLTQSRLAKNAGVSQSLVAKIESGALDPSYSIVQSVFGALADEGKKTELTAGQVCRRKIISINYGSSIHDAIKLMRKNEFSQAPVVQKGIIVGTVSETSLLNAVNDGKKIVGEAMTDSPPQVSASTPAKTLASLLLIHPLVIVADKGKPIGLVTKSDLLEKMY